MKLVRLFLFVMFAVSCRAQDLTVHVIDQQTKQPVINAMVRLHYGCNHSMRPIELKQRTSDAGIAIFHSVSVSPLEFCVFPDLDAYASQELPYLFTSSQDAQSETKSLNKVFTTLPTEVTFHVSRRSFFERIRHLAAYD